jgi:FKBP-type peptidyl-prolyl cis-trans isomerase FkpA
MSNRSFLVAAFCIVLLGGALFFGLNSKAPAIGGNEANASPPPPAPNKDLIMTDRTVGTGAEAVPQKTVSVHYTGWLYDPAKPDQKGKQFDSSLTTGKPFEFVLGAGMVIKGWDQGVAGMRVGGKRTLVIPPDLAYGSRGAAGVIPPGATLVFDVELLGVR